MVRIASRPCLRSRRELYKSSSTTASAHDNAKGLFEFLSEHDDNEDFNFVASRRCLGRVPKIPRLLRRQTRHFQTIGCSN